MRGRQKAASDAERQDHVRRNFRQPQQQRQHQTYHLGNTCQRPDLSLLQDSSARRAREGARDPLLYRRKSDEGNAQGNKVVGGVEGTGLAVSKTCFPVRFYKTNPHVETLRKDLASVTPTDFASMLVTSDHPRTRAQAGLLSARERTESRGGNLRPWTADTDTGGASPKPRWAGKDRQRPASGDMSVLVKARAGGAGERGSSASAGAGARPRQDGAIASGGGVLPAPRKDKVGKVEHVLHVLEHVLEHACAARHHASCQHADYCETWFVGLLSRSPSTLTLHPKT